MLSAQTVGEEVADSIARWRASLAEGDRYDQVFRADELLPVQRALAGRLVDEGNHDLAQLFYDTVLSYPQTHNGRLELGLDRTRLLLLRHMPATALDSLLPLEPLSQGSLQARWQWMDRYAEVLTQLDSASHALALYDSLLTLAPDTILWEVLANRGYQLAYMGRCSEAIASMERSLACIPPGYARDSLVVIANLALCHGLAGEHDTALTLIHAALAGFVSGSPDHAVTQRKQAEILWWAGQRGASAEAFRRYVAEELDLLARQWPALTLRARQDYWGTKRPLLCEAFSVAGEAGTTEWLFDLALRRRAIATAQASAPTAGGLRASLGRNERAVDFVRFTDLDSLARYIAFVATPTGLHCVPLWTERELHNHPVGDTTLKDAVCSTRTRDKTLLYEDTLLLRQLWQPLLPYMEGATDVWFAPDGLLHMLAIEQAPLPGITFHRVSTLATLTRPPVQGEDLASLPLLAIGGLDYNTLPPCATDEGGGEGEAPLPTARISLQRGGAVSLLYDALDGADLYFPALPQTRAEVDALDSLLPDTHVLHEMSEEDFKQRFSAPAAPTLLHLATHGYALDVGVRAQPLFRRDELTEDRSLLASALVLSGANEASHRHGGRDDGLLTAREIAQLDLSGCPLAVLSACQSGLGTVSDEGAAGLVRALKQAGAGSIIASLWEVSDQATALFMQHLYTHMANGEPLRRAFNHAQGELRRLTQEEPDRLRTFSSAALATRWRNDPSRTITTTPYDDPYFWAAFILIEDN